MSTSKNKVELMSMGSNQININGEIVSKTHWEGYSPDGERINLNFYSNGNTGRVENLNLTDFGYMLNRPFVINEDDDMNKIKRNFNPINQEFKDILRQQNKKSFSLDKNGKTKKKRNSRSPYSSTKKKNKKKAKKAKK